MLKTFKRHMAIRKLEGMRKPDPEYARHRLAQLTGERRERWIAAVGDIL